MYDSKYYREKYEYLSDTRLGAKLHAAKDKEYQIVTHINDDIVKFLHASFASISTDAKNSADFMTSYFAKRFMQDTYRDGKVKQYILGSKYAKERDALNRLRGESDLVEYEYGNIRYFMKNFTPIEIDKIYDKVITSHIPVDTLSFEDLVTNKYNIPYNEVRRLLSMDYFGFHRVPYSPIFVTTVKAARELNQIYV